MSTELCVLLIVAIVIAPVIIVVLKSKGGRIKASLESDKKKINIEFSPLTNNNKSD